jgi:hypothetical protein
MSSPEFLAEEFADSSHMSQSAIQLCCAIAEDSQGARYFDGRGRFGSNPLGMGFNHATAIAHDSGPLASELTSLIA